MEKLSYVFELDGKVHGFEVAVDKMAKADTVMGHLDRKMQILQTRLRQLKAPGEILRLEKEIANFGKLDTAIEKTGKKAHSMFSAVFLGELAARTVERLTEKVLELGKEALHAAGAAERMDLSFELTLGQKGAEDILGWIEKIAHHTEFTDDQLKGWALQLGNAGIKGEALKDTVTAVLDVAAKRGAGAGEAAVDALTRATLSGKIEGRALRGLGIPVADLAQLDKFKGLTEDQINKRLDDVAVTKSDLLNLIAGPDKMLGDKGLRASETFEARMHHLVDLPDQFFQALSKTEAFNKFSSAIGKVLEKLDPDSPAGKRIFGALETTFDAVARSIDRIDFDAVADSITNDVLPALKGMADMIQPTLDAIERVLRGMHRMKVAVFGMGVDEGPEVAARRAERLEKKKVETNFPAYTLQRGEKITERRGAFHLVGESDEKLRSKLEEEFNLVGKAAGDGMAEGMTSATDRVSRAARDVVKKGAIDPARDEAGAHSPATKFIDLGMDIGDGLVVGFQRQQDEIANMARGLVQPPTAPAPGFGSGVSLSIGDVTVQVMGTGDPQSDGDAAGAAFVSAIRGPLLELLEERDLEGS